MVKAKFKKSDLKKTVLKGLWHAFIFGMQVTLLVICLYRILPVPVTPYMLFQGNGVQKDWVPMSKISPAMPKAALTSEDPTFLHHYGFDFRNIVQSIEDNLEDDKRLRGASTITQQMVKNLFLWSDRSFIRKGIEAYLTIWIEAFWNKKRIMEVYLNIIEMGDGIYGIEQASQFYFKKPASALNASESALIVACFPNPIRYTPIKPVARIKRKQAWILRMQRYSDKIPEWWFR